MAINRKSKCQEADARLMDRQHEYCEGKYLIGRLSSKSAQIPAHIYNACEAEAVKRRKKTGKLIRWTEVLFEIAEKSLGVKGQQ